MHHAQEVALRMFLEHGFDDVTVEQVAAEAEVSPSTIYRYFGTKEGLLIRDEFDDRALSQVATLLTSDLDLPSAFRAALVSIHDEHFIVEAEMTRKRTAMVMETPSLRMASAARLTEITDQLADAVASARGYPRPTALALVAALLGCMMAALYTWYEADGTRTFLACLDESLEALNELHTLGGDREE